MPSGEGRRRESPRGPKAQESTCPRPELILREALEGDGFPRRDQTAEAPIRGREVLWGSAGAERTAETSVRSPGRRQGSEERSPGALGAERGLQGSWDLKARREGSQTLGRDIPRAGQSFRDAGSKGSAHKWVPVSGNAEGPNSLREALVERGLRST
jgi:hypothetical protein